MTAAASNATDTQPISRISPSDRGWCVAGGWSMVAAQLPASSPASVSKRTPGHLQQDPQPGREAQRNATRQHPGRRIEPAIQAVPERAEQQDRDDELKPRAGHPGPPFGALVGARQGRSVALLAR